MYLFALCLMLLSWRADAESDIPRAYRVIAFQEKVPADIVYAVATVESRYFIKTINRNRPWPWTLNIEKKPYFFKTRAEAIQKLNNYLRTGGESVAIGVMQIYWRWHKDKFKSPGHALEPYYNIRIGARYLRRKYMLTNDWYTAVGHYHDAGTSPEALQRAEHYRKLVYRELR